MRFLFTFIFLTISSFCFSQDCPYITGAMINACGSSEGPNEFVTFNTGGNPLTIANFDFSYGSTTPPPFNTNATLWINGGASGTVLSSQPAGISLTGCSTINVVTDVNFSIPAGANVVMMYSSTTLTTFDLTTQCSGGSVYVFFVNTANTAAADGFSSSGNFSNNPNSGEFRYLNITNSAAPCSGANNVVGYSGTAIQNWGSNADGNAVLWNSSGAPTYVNGGCFAIAPLPLEFLDFNVSLNSDGVKLVFETASEINNDHFVVERSMDGRSYESIGKIEAKNNTYEISKYGFIDPKPFSGINNYRIKQIDFDGQFSYSDVKSINHQDKQENSFTVNNRNDELQIITSLETYNVVILNTEGRSIKTYNSLSGDQNISTESLHQGVYFVKLSDKISNEVIKFIKY